MIILQIAVVLFITSIAFGLFVGACFEAVEEVE